MKKLKICLLISIFIVISIILLPNVVKAENSILDKTLEDIFLKDEEGNKKEMIIDSKVQSQRDAAARTINYVNENKTITLKDAIKNNPDFMKDWAQYTFDYNVYKSFLAVLPSIKLNDILSKNAMQEMNQHKGTTYSALDGNQTLEQIANSVDAAADLKELLGDDSYFVKKLKTINPKIEEQLKEKEKNDKEYQNWYEKENDKSEGANGTINPIFYKPGELEDDDVKALGQYGGRIAGFIQIVGTIVSIGTLMVIGIRYMLGSAEEKAEYKERMMPYIIGAILLFAASNVVNIIYEIFSPK